MRVLITGAGGFTGGHLVPRLLAEGVEVSALQSPGRVCRDPAVRWLSADLQDVSALAQAVRSAAPDCVIHLAGLSFVGHPEPRDFYQVNTLGTENLLQAIDEQAPHIERILLASSASVYGMPKTSRVPETLCPAPINHYACSKLAMEHMVRARFSHLPVILARPFNYTGPGQNPQFLVPKIVNHFAERRSAIELGNIDVSRDFSDVRDVVEWMWSLLSAELSDEPVNLCSGVAVSIREILAAMAELCGYAIEVRVNPAFVRAHDVPVLIGDNSRLQQLIGPVRARPLRATLAAMTAAKRP